MLCLKWDPMNGICVPDGKVAEKVSEILSDLHESNYHLIGSELLINEFRLRIVRGEIASSEVRFIVDGEDKFVNSYGGFDDWPVGFCDKVVNQMMEIGSFRRLRYTNIKKIQ